MTRTLIWRIVGSIGGAEWFICGSTNEEELSETFDLREHHCFADLSLIAAPALAHQCTNASKSDPAAGAQIVFGPDEQPIFITQGLLSRIDRGLVDAETGEGFHGIIAFDLDGDGAADVSTWIGVGPDGQIPLEAQFAGPACRGLTNVGVYLTQCVNA